MKKSLTVITLVGVLVMAVFIIAGWRDRCLHFKTGDVGTVITTNHNRNLDGKKIVDSYKAFVSRERDKRMFELCVSVEQFQALNAGDTVLGRPGRRIAKVMIAELPAIPAVDDEDNPTRLNQSGGGTTETSGVTPSPLHDKRER